MSASESQELGKQVEDNSSSSEVLEDTFENSLVKTSLSEVDTFIPKQEEELRSVDESKLGFYMSKRCTNITHCRDIMYDILNICFLLSRYRESYYRYDDMLAVSNDQTKAF